jgi:hypothetical protein
MNTPAQHSRKLALVAAFALAMLIHRQGLPHLSTHVFGGASGDGVLYLFLLQTAFKSLLPGSNFTLPAFYPYLGSLTWSDNYVLPSLLAFPLLPFFSLPLVHNSLLILATVLSGYCTYILATDLGISFVGGLLAMVSFEGFPFFAAHLGHAQLQWAFVFPLGITLLRRALKSGSSPEFFYFGLTLTTALLCSVYYFIFLLVTTAVCIVFSPREKFTFSSASTALGAMILPLIPFIPLLTSYLRTKAAFGGRMSHEISAFSANIYSYLSPTPNSQWHAHFSFGQDVERSLFMGFIPIILALYTVSKGPFYSLLSMLCALLAGYLTPPTTAGYLTWVSLLFSLLALRFRKHSPITFLVALLITALISSFGLKSGVGVFDLAYHYVPSIDGVRAVGRWGVLVALSVSLLAGMAISRLPRIGVIFLLALVWEVTPRTIGLEPLPPTPAVFREVPKNSVALVLPLTETLTPAGAIASYSDFARKNTNAMNWGAQHRATVVNGYSGIRSRFLDELPGRLSNIGDPEFLTTLFGINDLDYIVFTKTPDLQNIPPEVKELLVKEGEDGSALLKAPTSIKLLGKIKFVGRAGTLLRITVVALKDKTTILFKGTKYELALGESKTLESLFITRNTIPEAIEFRSNQVIQIKKRNFTGDANS